MPLAKGMENWPKIGGTKGTGKKRSVALSQEDWPLLTHEGNPAERWPLQGTFDQQELTFCVNIWRTCSLYKWIICMYGIIGHLQGEKKSLEKVGKVPLDIL